MRHGSWCEVLRFAQDDTPLLERSDETSECYFHHVSSEWVISTKTSSSVARRAVSSRTSQWRSRARRKTSGRTSAPDSTRSDKIFQPLSSVSPTSRTPRDFLQLSRCVIRADLRFQRHSAGRPNATEQIFRRVARFDSPFVDDDDAACRSSRPRAKYGSKAKSYVVCRDS